MRKSLGIIALVILFAFTMGSCKSEKYNDGIYQGTGNGKGGELVVQVTVNDGDIETVELISSHETEMISDAAIQKILGAVNQEKSVNVDAVSGASMTSYALLDAIKMALRETGGDDKTLEIFRVNKAYLSRLMKQELKATFIDYLTSYRIKNAKELLLQSGDDLKMYQIAAKVGFSSQHYFSRVFRNIEEMSPMEFRRKQ